MIYDSVENIIIDDLFFKARAYCNNINVYIKLEGLNIPGSIKLKPAKFMIDEAEKSGTLTKDSKIIESSSGNLGVALSHICASRNYPFICVTDVKASEQNIQVMKALGTEVVVIDKLDANCGYVEHRLIYINERLRADPHMVWLNQYANPQNTKSHFETTARSMLTEFEKIDYLFIGAGTTGTLMGCLKRFKIDSPNTTIVAVDSTGSINFSDQAGKRYLAGIGSSRRPEILELDLLKETILIDEKDSIRHCRRLAKQYGILAGASTGTVLAAVEKWSSKFTPQDTVVTISPDWGRSYLDTVYDEAWVLDTFGLIS